MMMMMKLDHNTEPAWSRLKRGEQKKKEEEKNRKWTHSGRERGWTRLSCDPERIPGVFGRVSQRSDRCLPGVTRLKKSTTMAEREKEVLPTIV